MTTATASYQIRHSVHALSSRGLGYKAIARLLGMPRDTVRHHARAELPRFDPARVIEAACGIKGAVGPDGKRVNADLGPCQLLDMLAKEWGVTRSELGVSETTLSREFKKRGLSVPCPPRSGDNAPPYWLENYDRPGRIFQIDTVKLVLSDAQQVELVTVFDVVSRAAWAEVLPADGSICWCLDRAFQALGVPEVVSTDNGAGFVLETPTRLSEVTRFCFQRGVRRFVFIRVACPWQNGGVERWHRTMKRGAWLHRGRAEVLMPEDVPAWLHGFLDYYNTVKSHTALGGKSKRTTPATAHGAFNLLPVAPHDPRFGPSADAADDPQEGVVTYMRQVSSTGLARIDAPSMLINVGTPSAFGRVLRFDFDISDGSGRVFMFPDDNPGQPELIGTFEHALTGSAVKLGRSRSKKAQQARQAQQARPGADGFILVDLLPGVALVPRPFDEVEQLETERRHLKKGVRRPLPSGYRYEQDENGDWLVVNRYGRVMTTAYHRIVYHLGDALGEGWGEDG